MVLASSRHVTVKGFKDDGMQDSLGQIQSEHGIEPINQAFEIVGHTLMEIGFFSGSYVPKEDILKP